MKFSKLGQTSLSVSKICLGTMTFGEQNTEAEAHQQLDYALDHEVNFIDTAEMYAVPGRKETQGLTEKYIGSWIKKRNHRSKFILATKIAGPSEGLKYIRNPLNFSPEQIRIALEGSLKRLQTDYVDIYQLHWPERSTNTFGKLGFDYNPNDPWKDNFLEIVQELNALIKEGKIRHYGLSNETPWGMMRFIQLADMHGLPRPVSIQNPYSLLNRTFEVGLAEMSIREHIGLLAYSPMAFGLLSGKYHKGTASDQSRLKLFPKLSRYSSSVTYDVASKYIKIAEEAGLSPAQMALAFVNSRPFVTANIIGATTMEQLVENIESVNTTLSPDVLKAIESVHNENSNPAP